ncbi:MAG: hypothetical protein ACXAC7_19650, partial [Candidatus Hodarchaeales archaeon]
KCPYCKKTDICNCNEVIENWTPEKDYECPWCNYYLIRTDNYELALKILQEHEEKSEYCKKGVEVFFGSIY